MAIRNIIQLGDDVLRKKSFPVEKIDDKILTLLDDMKETLEAANGVGLAAPQVGVLKRIFIVSYEGKYFECINPEMIKQSGKQTGEEACLSIKGKSGVVERPYKVTVKAFNRKGEEVLIKASGFMAKAFCHEYDHLDGILYIDRAKSVQNEE